MLQLTGREELFWNFKKRYPERSSAAANPVDASVIAQRVSEAKEAS